MHKPMKISERRVLDEFKKSNLARRSVQTNVGENRKFGAVLSLHKKGLIKIIEHTKHTHPFTEVISYELSNEKF